MARVSGGQGRKATVPGVLRIAHVQDGDAVRIAVADISIAAVHHDLDAVTAPALVGVANELDVAGCDRIHGSPLPFRAAPGPRHRVGGEITSSVRPLVSDASEFTRLRVGSPPERTVRSSARRTELRLRHRSGGAFGGTDRQARRKVDRGAPRRERMVAKPRGSKLGKDQRAMLGPGMANS